MSIVCSTSMNQPTPMKICHPERNLCTYLAYIHPVSFVVVQSPYNRRTKAQAELSDDSSMCAVRFEFVKRLHEVLLVKRPRRRLMLPSEMAEDLNFGAVFGGFSSKDHEGGVSP